MCAPCESNQGYPNCAIHDSSHSDWNSARPPAHTSHLFAFLPGRPVVVDVRVTHPLSLSRCGGGMAGRGERKAKMHSSGSKTAAPALVTAVLLLFVL